MLLQNLGTLMPATVLPPPVQFDMSQMNFGFSQNLGKIWAFPNLSIYKYTYIRDVRVSSVAV